MQFNKKQHNTLMDFSGGAVSVTEVAQIATTALTIASVYFENKKGFIIRDCTQPSDEEIGMAHAERQPAVLSARVASEALRMK